MEWSYFIDYKVSGIKCHASEGSNYDNGRLDIKEQYPTLRVMHLSQKTGTYANQCKPDLLCMNMPRFFPCKFGITG